MKLIFLDVDGVLNTVFTRESLGHTRFVEDKFVLRLKEICDKTNAKVVLSSSWRKGWYDIENGKEETKDALDFKALKEKLLEFQIELFDKTPCINDMSRGLEIQQWFLDHKDLKVENFVVLDDMEIVRPYNRYLLQTSPVEGLREKHIKKVIKMLGGMTNESEL